MNEGCETSGFGLKLFSGKFFLLFIEARISVNFGYIKTLLMTNFMFKNNGQTNV